MLIQLGGGNTETWFLNETGEEEFWEAAMDKEDSAVLVVPTPISSAAIPGPIIFTAWMVQLPDEYFQIYFISNHICNTDPPLYSLRYSTFTTLNFNDQENAV